MKYFNTVGPIDPKKHYFLPRRLDWNEITGYIEKQFYFVLHAPRQSGKTTAVIEFVKHLNQEKQYTALYLSVESARIAVNDVKRAVHVFLDQFKNQISNYLPAEVGAITYLEKMLTQERQENDVYNFLRFWSMDSKKPLVLFFDEFDVLAGDSLIAMLTQLRTGYPNRPKYFPQSICLIGVRDLRDYKIQTKQQEDLGVLYSPWNIKAESERLRDFSRDDVKKLYLQHTEETLRQGLGQQFTDEAIDYAFHLTQGQPWLVNALAYQACFRDVLDRNQVVTKEIIERAKEALIQRCDTHIDSLAHRLKERRVLNIIDAIICGDTGPANVSSDDLQYARDLGLITQKGVAIANPIYQEIIPRSLIYAKQEMITTNPLLYRNADGSFNTTKMLTGLGQFFRENAEIWAECFDYKESGPHLLVMAFLQRIINGGGMIHREYALGTKRVDIAIKWPFGLGDRKQIQCIVIELKVLRNKNTLSEGLCQTTEYMDKSHATEGHLIIFDPDKTKSWDEKIYHRMEKIGNKNINVWGM